MNKSASELLKILNRLIISMLALAIIASLLMIVFQDYLRRFPTCDF